MAATVAVTTRIRTKDQVDTLWDKSRGNPSLRIGLNTRSIETRIADPAYPSGHTALVLHNSVDNQLKWGPAAGRGLSRADLTHGLTVIVTGRYGTICDQGSLFEGTLWQQPAL